MATENATYVCRECGEEWQGEETPFHWHDKCVNCGAAGGTNKIIESEDDNSNAN